MARAEEYGFWASLTYLRYRRQSCDGSYLVKGIPMRKYIVGLLAVAFLGISGVANALPIVYRVDISDATESVAGTITTNGMSGPLGAGDITAWSLSATGPFPARVASTSGPPGYLVCFPDPGCVSADPAGLRLDFSGTGSYLSFVYPSARPDRIEFEWPVGSVTVTSASTGQR
jgi:hypothetical protein